MHMLMHMPHLNLIRCWDELTACISLRRLRLLIGRRCSVEQVLLQLIVTDQLPHLTSQLLGAACAS